MIGCNTSHNLDSNSNSNPITNHHQYGMIFVAHTKLIIVDLGYCDCCFVPPTQTAPKYRPTVSGYNYCPDYVMDYFDRGTPLHELCANKSVTVELLQWMHTCNPDAAREKNNVSM